MGLNATFMSGVKLALKTVKEFTPVIIYHRVEPGVYDPLTDTSNDTITTTELDSPLITGLSEDEQAWIQTDKKGAKLLIARKDYDVEPLITDYVTIGGERWEIVKKKRVPGDSVWILVIQGG